MDFRRDRQIISEARRYIFVCVAVFACGAVAGYGFPSRFAGLVEGIYSLAGQLSVSSAPVVILTLFLQNSSSALVAVWLGAALGLVPIFGALANGIILGAVLTATGSGLKAFISLLPHGVFELPAIFIAWGLGLWRGMWVFEPERKRAYKERGRKAWYVFFTLVLPLLAVAAVIEGMGIVLMR